MNQRYLLILLLGMCVASTLHAQDSIRLADTKEEKELSVELNPVVVTGTGTHQRLKNTPAPVEVITANDIKRAGITDFQQAMTMMLPSLSFSPNAMGSFLMMNGLSNKYVLILVNGKKLIGDMSNNIDLARIDMSRVKRIEVLNGAASSLYGSDAIAGVINIITDEPKDIIRMSTDTKYEEYGQFTQSVNVDVATKMFASYTSYRHEQTDGWQQNPLAYKNAETLEAEPTLSKAVTAFHANTVNQKFTFTPTEKLSFYVNGGYYWRLTDRAPKNDQIDGGSLYNMHYESYNFGAGGRYKFNRKSSVSLDVTNDNYRQSYKYITGSGDFKIGDYSKVKNQRFTEAELKGIFRLTEKSTTIAGVDYRMESLDRPSSNVDKSVYTASAYGQHEMKFWNSLTAIAGLRYDYHETVKGRLTPKVALMYSLKNINIRGTYSAGYRAPGLDELYYYKFSTSTVTKGNADLKPESSNYFSLNMEYNTSRFNFSVTGYLNYIDDMINARNTKFSDMPAEEADALRQKFTEDLQLTDSESKKLANLKEYRNLEKGTVKGINISSLARLGTDFSVSGNYAFAYARGKDMEGVWDIIDRSVRHTGTFTGNFSHSWNTYRLNINLNARLQSKRYHPGHSYGDAPGYGIWDLNTRHTFNGFRHFYIEPGVGINNLFNKVDDRPIGVNYSLLSPGRTVYVSLALRIK